MSVIFAKANSTDYSMLFFRKTINPTKYTAYQTVMNLFGSALPSLIMLTMGSFVPAISARMELYCHLNTRSTSLRNRIAHLKFC